MRSRNVNAVQAMASGCQEPACTAVTTQILNHVAALTWKSEAFRPPVVQSTYTLLLAAVGDQQIFNPC